MAVARKVVFSKEQIPSHPLDRVQRNQRTTNTEVNRVNETLAANPFIKGKAVTGQVFTGGVNLLVQHNLGYAPTGYIITRSYGANVGVRCGEPTPAVAAPDPLNQIYLTTTLNATFDFWFY